MGGVLTKGRRLGAGGIRSSKCPMVDSVDLIARKKKEDSSWEKKLQGKNERLNETEPLVNPWIQKLHRSLGLRSSTGSQATMAMGPYWSSRKGKPS